MIELSGVFTSEFKFNTRDNDTPIVYTLSYMNDEDEKHYKPIVEDMVRTCAHSGGLQAELKYSSTLNNIIGKPCEVKLTLSATFVVELILRVKKVELYEGRDSCFPWVCGRLH